jgi:hypothetical protein
MKPPARTATAMLALALASYVAAVGPAEIRADDLLCEEAAARLKDCCPDLDPARIRCDHGCDNERLAIDESESECIRDLDCDAVKEQRVCERVLARAGSMPTEAGTLVGPNGETVDATVCP